MTNTDNKMSDAHVRDVCWCTVPVDCGGRDEENDMGYTHTRALLKRQQQ